MLSCQSKSSIFNEHQSKMNLKLCLYNLANNLILFCSGFLSPPFFFLEEDLS